MQLRFAILSIQVRTDHMSYILTVIDVFTGFVLLFALPDKSAETVAAKLWEVICLIGPHTETNTE